LVVLGFGPERFDPHQPHQPPHALAVNRKALLAQRPRDPPGPEERTRGEQRVNAPHRLEVVVVGRSRLAIDARARQAQHGALPADRQADMRAIELGSTVRRAHLPNLLAKKSFSIVSWPILA
jgi:hypothetical protein